MAERSLSDVSVYVVCGCLCVTTRAKEKNYMCMCDKYRFIRGQKRYEVLEFRV